MSVSEQWLEPAARGIHDAVCGCNGPRHYIYYLDALARELPAPDDRGWRSKPSTASNDHLIEGIAEELYAAGPWGDFFCFADGGARVISDAHKMSVYKEIVRDVVVALGRIDRP